MVQLAAGPVWLTSSIQAFAQSWSRQPGRPPKTAGRVKARGASRDEVRAAAKRAERRAAAKTGMTRPAPEVLEGLPTAGIQLSSLSSKERAELAAELQRLARELRSSRDADVQHKREQPEAG
jgi:hypothetical protein